MSNAGSEPFLGILGMIWRTQVDIALCWLVDGFRFYCWGCVVFWFGLKFKVHCVGWLQKQDQELSQGIQLFHIK